MDGVPADWREALALDGSAFAGLDAHVAAERAVHEVYPAQADVFRALKLTPFKHVAAVIVGQDPYQRPGLADGLAFSVRPGSVIPPSLRNILHELDKDLRQHQVTDGSLVPWAEHGVLLLNRILTVTRDRPGSHAGFGWEPFTLAIATAVARQPGPVAFLLWGARAATLLPVIDPHRHVVLTSSHPSPISARLGFIGSAPFRTANEDLKRLGATPIDWQL